MNLNDKMRKFSVDNLCTLLVTLLVQHNMYEFQIVSVAFVQSVLLHHVFPRYNIISSYLLMCFPSSLFPQVFQTKTLYAFFIYSIHVLCHTDLIICDWSTKNFEALYFVSFCAAFFIVVALFLSIC
jgi:hypothetical protein